METTDVLFYYSLVVDVDVDWMVIYLVDEMHSCTVMTKNRR